MSAAPIVISFAVEGQQAVKGVFDSMEQRMIRFDQEATKSQQRSAQERTSGTKREVDQREREYARLVKDAEKWEREGVKETERAAKAKEKVAEAEAKRKVAIRETSMRMAHQLLEQEVRDEQRAEERKTRIVETEARRRAAAETSSRRSYGHAIGHAGMSSVGSTLSTAMGMATGVLTLGGGFAVGDAMRKDMSFSRTVAQTSNMSYIPGTTTREQVAPSVIEGMAKGTQALTNIDKEDVANGIKRYVGLSSDFEGLHGKTSSGRSGLQELAILSKASGTPFEPLMEAAASVKANNTGLNTEGLISTVRAMLGAGKQGTLPLDQMAQYVGEIQASAGRFSGSETSAGMTKSQQQLLGLVQLAGRATGGDAARAAMAVKDFTGDIAREGHKIGMTGSLVYPGGDSKNGMLAPHDLLANFYAKTGGKFDIEQKTFGQRSMPLADALNPIYAAAEKAQKGSGVEAVRSAVKGFENQSYSPEDTMKEFGAVMATDGERIDKAFMHVEEVIEARAVPFIERFAGTLEEKGPEIEKFVNALADVAEFMVSHPWAALFGVMGANLTKDVGSAMIGLAIKNAVTASTTAGIASSMPLMAGLIGAAAASAIALGIAAIDRSADKDAEKQGRNASAVAQTGALIERLRQGRGTSEDVKKAHELQATLAGVLTDESGPSVRKAFSVTSGVGGALAGALAGGGGIGALVQAMATGLLHENVDRPMQSQMAKEVATQTTAMNELTAALKAARDFVGPSGPSPAGGASGLPGLGGGALPTNAPNRNHSMSHPSRGGLG